MIAHRGCSDDSPEMSMAAYEAATPAFTALEVSLSRTADGVWFGLHDRTIDRTSGTTGMPPADQMTWAEIQRHQIVQHGQTAPYAALIDILDSFPQEELWIDPKYQLEHLDELLSILDGRQDQTVIKYHHGGKRVADAAQMRGFRSWGFYFDADLPRFTETCSWWDMLGIDWRASADWWDRALATGKPVVAHIVPDGAAADAAIAKGAGGLMCSSVRALDLVRP